MKHIFNHLLFVFCFATSFVASAKAPEVLTYVEKINQNHRDKLKEYIFYYHIKNKYVCRIEYFKDTIVLDRKIRFLYRKDMFKYDNKDRLINKQVWINRVSIMIENGQVYFNRLPDFKCLTEEKYTYEQPINF